MWGGSWVTGLVVEARAFQPRRHVSVTVRVCLIIQWGRARLGYMEEKRWEVTGLVGGFLLKKKKLKNFFWL